MAPLLAPDIFARTPPLLGGDVTFRCMQCATNSTGPARPGLSVTGPPWQSDPAGTEFPTTLPAGRSPPAPARWAAGGPGHKADS
eukprot:754256-Hanusia_phi.AAC.4